MNDPDQTIVWPVVGVNDGLPERIWAYDNQTSADDRPAVDPAAGFVSLAYIRAALKRSAWLWCMTAVAGLLIGSGLYVAFPPAYQASTSVLINDGPAADPSVAITTDAALAHSHTVAARVVQQLGLKQGVSSFLAAYSVTAVTDQLLQITVGAPTSNEAVQRASAVASAFLQFHGDYAQTQQQELAKQLTQQVTQAQQDVDSISRQISQVSAEPSSPAGQAKLNSLEAQRADANNTLGQVEQYAIGTLASGQTSTNTIVKGSEVVGTASVVPHSRLKGAALYVAGGLVAGLAIGMGIVVIMALVSTRLRRRNDVADALGAPVRLSVGTLRKRRWLPWLPGRASKSNLDMRRIVAYLTTTVPGRSRDPAGLAVVAIDNENAVAQSVVSLAVSYASQGKQVVMADLSEGANAARLLGVKTSGICAVSQNGANLKVVVPDRHEIAPVGPLRGRLAAVEPRLADGSLADACASADLLLTLATLDPASGGDHLGTWATDVVVMVTAGRSSAVRINAVGEMIRLSGTRLVSAVLIEADRSDESLGTTLALHQPDLAGPA